MERRRKNGRTKDDGGALTRVVEVGGAPASSEKRPWRLACLPATAAREQSETGADLPLQQRGAAAPDPRWPFFF
ncbi:unnamed protein product [Miscanthus lutarioriparius]|uniref:Uncharacterized protein n=1 Tax=Miscanthus lutarioriparius TaxID=422564 RepID=A0A811SB37_9POAL|nr:unnamed protein product [Miscanthus lutarioriparius]